MRVELHKLLFQNEFKPVESASAGSEYSSSVEVKASGRELEDGTRSEAGEQETAKLTLARC